jgi:hypothetical protein
MNTKWKATEVVVRLRWSALGLVCIQSKRHHWECIWEVLSLSDDWIYYIIR